MEYFTLDRMSEEGSRVCRVFVINNFNGGKQMNGKVFWKRGLLLLVALLVVLVVTATPAFALVNLGKTLPGGGLITPIGLATGVTLNESTLTLTENEMIASTTPTATLTATVTPSTADQAVTWSSSNTNVATVSNGVVTEAGPGAATITATTADGLTATCAVTSQVLEVLGGATDATGNTVIVTFTVPMAPPPSGSAGFIVERTVADIVDNVISVTLDSSSSDAYDLTLATPVQYKQLVMLGYLPGNLQTASGVPLPEFSLLSVHNTVPETATGVTLNTNTLNLTVGGPSDTLTATVTPSTADQAVTWISDTPGVATVNNGVVTAVAAGTANITVSTAGGGITSTCVVAVTAATATPTPTTTGAPSVTGISPSSGSTAGGTTVTITGSGFTGATAVNFGSAAATGATVNTDSSITATSPAGSAGAVDVTVVTPSGASTTSSNDQFTYATTTTTTPPATGQTVLQFYIGSANYNVNGQAQSMDTAPLISEGRTLLPIRYVATPLGATVNWDQSQQMVTVTLGSNTIQLVIGQNSASVNGVATPIDSTNPAVTPVIVAGRTMLPLRFIAESLGCQVNWNQAQQLVTVTYLQQ
jgi:hypothetical protein